MMCVKIMIKALHGMLGDEYQQIQILKAQQEI